MTDLPPNGRRDDCLALPLIDRQGEVQSMAKLYLHVEIDVKPGMRDAFVAKLHTHATTVRQEAGCERLEVLVDTVNDERVCKVFVWEIWTSQPAWDAHMSNAASAAWRPVAQEYVIGESITVMGAA